MKERFDAIMASTPAGRDADSARAHRLRTGRHALWHLSARDRPSPAEAQQLSHRLRVKAWQTTSPTGSRFAPPACLPPSIRWAPSSRCCAMPTAAVAVAGGSGGVGRPRTHPLPHRRHAGRRTVPQRRTALSAAATWLRARRRFEVADAQAHQRNLQPDRRCADARGVPLPV